MRYLFAFLPFIFCVGCQNQLALYQSVGAANVAVTTATSLYNAKVITKTDAQTVLKSAQATEAALHAWQAAIAIGGIGATSSQAIVAGDISAMLANLQALQSHTTASAKLKLTKYSAPAPLKSSTALNVSDIIQLVELGVTLAPEIEQMVGSIFGATTVTTADVTSAFIALDSSIAALSAAIGP